MEWLSNMWEKIKNWIYVDDTEGTDEPSERKSGEIGPFTEGSGRGREDSQLFEIKDSVISLHYPTKLNDAKAICDRVKNKEAVIVDIDGLQGEQKQRLLDFLSGVILARDGVIMKLNGSIVLCAPANVKVDQKARKQ